MQSSVYRFSIRPEPDMELEVRVKASNVADARRMVRRFFEEHDGRGWTVEHVSREASRGPVRFYSMSHATRISSAL